MKKILLLLLPFYTNLFCNERIMLFQMDRSNFFYLQKNGNTYMYPEEKLTEKQKIAFLFFYRRQSVIGERVYLLFDYLKEIKKSALTLGESVNILFQNELLCDRAVEEYNQYSQKLEKAPSTLLQLQENKERYEKIVETNLNNVKQLIENFNK